MQEILSLAFESGRAIRHDPFPLGRPNLSAKVGLARLAELAFFAFGSARDWSAKNASHITIRDD